MLGATSSNKAILAARCFLWWILQQGYYLTDHSLLFHYMPLLPSACIGSCWNITDILHTRLLYGVRAALASSSSMKFDGFTERQWPINAWPLRWWQFYNVAMPLPAHRRLLLCTTCVQGSDSETYRVIILIPEPSWLKLPMPFLLTPWLHYLLISSPQKCSARSGKPLKSSAVSTLSLPLFPPTHPPLFSFLLVSSSSLSPHSVDHACPSRPGLPVPNKLFSSLGNRGEGEKGRSVEKGTEVHVGEEQSTLHLQQELCCLIQPDVNAEVTGGMKTRVEETNSSILFQLHVRLSNDLLSNQRYATPLHSLAWIWTLFFF